ncbi:hypothetical protein D3C81_847820 [compost metagenome]
MAAQEAPRSLRFDRGDWSWRSSKIGPHCRCRPGRCCRLRRYRPGRSRSCYGTCRHCDGAPGLRRRPLPGTAPPLRGCHRAPGSRASVRRHAAGRPRQGRAARPRDAAADRRRRCSVAWARTGCGTRRCGLRRYRAPGRSSPQCRPRACGPCRWAHAPASMRCPSPHARRTGCATSGSPSRKPT